MEVKLGSTVRDDITGFEGVATARCKYINGCIQYEITPLQLKDGVPQKEYWLDEKRVVLLEDTTGKSIDEICLGGPAKHPTKKNPPSLAGYEQEE